MRVFFAIELEEEIKDYLFSMQQKLRKICNGGNFTHKDNFHLTLRFMGEQSEEQLLSLKNALTAAASEAQSFELRLWGLGAFNKGSKKIIWTGLEKSKELQGLYQSLETALEQEGYPREERSYSPHITLARETRLESGFLETGIIPVERLSVRVASISLMESARVNNRLCYQAVHKEAFRF
ncbi:2'-5'-RNA ligase [Ruminiclostridium hungatei]|uniref:RNA 2',3'-cyclic phosphodiesterase n=1 Tax=Ruminiclostridium hungatei TaxID=48256 RepID=A0A1V4SJ33_RUMHU|nr:RNA 2',3'-cyclic phosphodiesterase [Ruminiclostridium hungatei]OPX43475.1 2'-5'-RNA ligase [Ruminiclostridium hungatei]